VLLSEIAEVSRTVAGTSARLAKIEALAGALRTAGPLEVPIAVAYLSGELPQRQFGLAVRLEVAAGCPQHLAQLLLNQFELQEVDLYRCDGPVNLARMAALVDEADLDEYKYPAFLQGLPDRLVDQPDILAVLRQRDVLLHHPFQSFDPVVDFIRRAVEDPDVLAIKQTVYRTGVNSVLMEALIEAARRGKEVTVVVELLARFDEEANINWAERLEQAGAQVVYGVFGLKTHAKMALLLRRETDAAGRTKLQPYAHLGTGNYHPRTTRQYTDFGLLTTNAELCAAKDKSSITIAADGYSTADGKCSVGWIVETAGSRGPNYAVHARCEGDAQNARADVVNMILRPEGGDRISIGKSFTDLKPYLRCP